MTFRVPALAAVFVCSAALSQAQVPMQLQISNGRVTLHAENVPVRNILAEWQRIGGANIINADRVTGSPLTLELVNVPERQALDIILRGVSGYVVAAREPGTPGASIYDRIMILPTSAAPRNPTTPNPPPFTGVPGGIVRPPVITDQDDIQDDQSDPNDGNPLARPVPIVRPGFPGSFPGTTPVMPPPITIVPEQGPMPQTTPPVVSTPTNPFGLPPGSSTRPGVMTPAPPTTPPQPPAAPGPQE